MVYIEKKTMLERIVGLYKQNILFRLQSTYIYYDRIIYYILINIVNFVIISPLNNRSINSHQ